MTIKKKIKTFFIYYVWFVNILLNKILKMILYSFTNTFVKLKIL